MLAVSGDLVYLFNMHISIFIRGPYWRYKQTLFRQQRNIWIHHFSIRAWQSGSHKLCRRADIRICICCRWTRRSYMVGHRRVEPFQSSCLGEKYRRCRTWFSWNNPPDTKRVSQYDTYLLFICKKSNFRRAVSPLWNDWAKYKTWELLVLWIVYVTDVFVSQSYMQIYSCHKPPSVI